MGAGCVPGCSFEEEKISCTSRNSVQFPLLISRPDGVGKDDGGGKDDDNVKKKKT